MKPIGGGDPAALAEVEEPGYEYPGRQSETARAQQSLLLLPTPPLGDAVTVGYGPEIGYLKGTFTPLTNAPFGRANPSIHRGAGGKGAVPRQLFQQFFQRPGKPLKQLKTLSTVSQDDSNSVRSAQANENWRQGAGRSPVARLEQTRTNGFRFASLKAMPPRSNTL